ncbi:MAG: hypothetical protein FJ271_08630 [Planctomycetes bacterium]|nr:hypothetical protein [Planctomycetota bacterium]
MQPVTLILLSAAFVCEGDAGGSAARPASKAVAKPLPEMLTISWRRGPDLPQGFQDSDGGIMAGTLVSVGGFCSGQKNVPGKPDKYPRGFLKKVWGLPLANDRSRWLELPDFPGAARQGLDAISIADTLYCWGGFSYSPPHCYRDGYQLSRGRDGWRWRSLPPLPWALTAQGSCAIGSKIYVVGGADYDGEKGFYTLSDRHGRVKRLGARLLIFDTNRPEDGWQERRPCPGTPRFVHAVAAVAGKVYVLGGATGSDNAESGTFTVVDNWVYQPEKNEWTALPDLPVASGNFPSGRVVFADRYILLVGGYQYGKVMTPRGQTRPIYGRPTRHDPKNAMCSDIFVFDTQTGIFGRASPLPLNNNLPMTVLAGAQLHLIGGEVGSAVIDGQQYGHHPELYLIGSIEKAK